MKHLLSASLVLALALGCASNTPATTTPTTPATSGAEAPATTPATSAPETPATTSATPATTPATPAATPATPAATPATPATAATAATPPSGGVDGHAVFNRACQRCHEDDTDGARTNLGWTEARMRTQIRNGSSRMRGIPAARLSDADLDTLIAYLRTTHAVR